MDETSYDAWMQELKWLPITWVPAILMELVEVAYKKNVFVRPHGASTLVRQVEDRIVEKEKLEKKKRKG